MLKTLDISGAGEGIRTFDLLITSQLVYMDFVYIY